MAGEDKKSTRSRATVGGDKKKKSTRKPVLLAYHVFLYREELRRPKVHSLKLSKAKYQLTTDLVAISWNDITSYSSEERDNLVHNIVYKKQLKNTIDEKSKAKRKALPQKK